MEADGSNYVVPELSGRGRPAASKGMVPANWQQFYARPTVLPVGDRGRPMHPRDGLRGLGFVPTAAPGAWKWGRVGINALSVYAGVQALRGKDVHPAITAVCLVGAVLDLIDAI